MNLAIFFCAPQRPFQQVPGAFNIQWKLRWRAIIHGLNRPVVILHAVASRLGLLWCDDVCQLLRKWSSRPLVDSAGGCFSQNDLLSMHKSFHAHLPRTGHAQRGLALAHEIGLSLALMVLKFGVCCEKPLDSQPTMCLVQDTHHRSLISVGTLQLRVQNALQTCLMEARCARFNMTLVGHLCSAICVDCLFPSVRADSQLCGFAVHCG